MKDGVVDVLQQCTAGILCCGGAPAGHAVTQRACRVVEGCEVVLHRGRAIKLCNGVRLKAMLLASYW